VWGVWVPPPPPAAAPAHRSTDPAVAPAPVEAAVPPPPRPRTAPSRAIAPPPGALPPPPGALPPPPGATTPPPGSTRELFPREPRRDIDVIVLGRDDLPPDLLPGWSRVGERGFGRKSDYWSPCVRDFVQTQPEPARAALGEALSLYSTSCTSGTARRVEFRTPPANRIAAAQSYLGVAGAIEPTTCDVALTAAYHGEPLRAERIVLIGDGVRWSSPRIVFDRDDGWEIATLPLSRSLVRAVRQALDARDTVLRFEAANDYQDVVVTDEMKHDLRVMLDALDAINRP
jgi:hypothetical protein